MMNEIERLAVIAGSFSRFVAPQEAGATPLEGVSVRDVVEETLNLYSTGEGAIRFENRIPRGLPPVGARESELKEVLINLLENARAAIPEDGLVTLSAEAVEGAVELRVTDDGDGIPPELIARVFEPHFSTRSTGTGLGLAIVHRLVGSWDGSVQIESELHSGTTIRIHLREWDRSRDATG